MRNPAFTFSFPRRYVGALEALCKAETLVKLGVTETSSNHTQPSYMITKEPCILPSSCHHLVSFARIPQLVRILALGLPAPPTWRSMIRQTRPFRNFPESSGCLANGSGCLPWCSIHHHTIALLQFMFPLCF